MELATIDAWDTGALDTMADSLGKRVATVSEVDEALRAASRLPGWYREGADSARQLYTLTADDLRDEAAVPGAARQLAVETSAAVNHLKGRLAGLRGQAETASMTIHSDGPSPPRRRRIRRTTRLGNDCVSRWRQPRKR